MTLFSWKLTIFATCQVLGPIPSPIKWSLYFILHFKQTRENHTLFPHTTAHCPDWIKAPFLIVFLFKHRYTADQQAPPTPLPPPGTTSLPYTPILGCFLVFICAFRYFGCFPVFWLLSGICMDRCTGHMTDVEKRNQSKLPGWRLKSNKEMEKFPINQVSEKSWYYI